MKVFKFILIFYSVILSMMKDASCDDLSTGPSIVDWPNFKLKESVDKLRDWMSRDKRSGEKSIMYIAYHTFAQRVAMRQDYEKRYKHYDDFLGESSSFTWDLSILLGGLNAEATSNLVDMTTRTGVFLALRIEHSFKENGLIGKDYGYMSILCTSTGNLLKDIRDTYTGVNAKEKTLEQRIEKELWNDDLRAFMLYLIKDPLRSNNSVDPAKTKKFLGAIPEEKGDCAKNQPLLDLLAKESFVQIKAVGDQYQKDKQQSAVDNIKKHCKGKLGEALVRVFSASMNSGEYFAEIIHDYVNGKGSISSAGPLVVISRSEIDLADIRTAYKKMNYGDLDTAFDKKLDGFNHRLMQVLVLGNRDPNTINDPKFN